MRKSELIFNILLVPLDFLMLVLAGVLTYFLRISPWLQAWRPTDFFFDYLPFSSYFLIAITVSFFQLVIFAIVGLYNSRINQGLLEQVLKVIVSCSAGITAITVFIFFSHQLFDSRFIVLGAWFLAVILVSLARIIMKKIWKKYNFANQKIVLIGDNHITEKIEKEIKNNPWLGYNVLTRLSNPDFAQINKHNADEVIFCNFNHSKQEISSLINFCEENQINFRFIPDLFETFFSNISVDSIAGFPIVEIKRTPLQGWASVIKRLIDIIVSLSGIIFLFPLGLILGLIIKIDSPGPILVKLKRVNQGKEFFVYKFRSMQNNAHILKSGLLERNERKDGPLFKMENDPRITKVGKFIRKTWVDEFPQLINILKGEMSLVGPRPHEPEEVEDYQRHHKRTFFVKPGMTGLAQIGGASKLKFEQEIKLDTYYIKNWSLWLDIKIILRTIVNFVKGLFYNP